MLPEDARVTGRVWLDADQSDISSYVAEYVEGVDEPLGDTLIQLLGTDGGSETTTCDDGQYGFGGLEDGTYLVVAPESPAGGCAQRNCATQLPVAVGEGDVKLLTIGDSVAVQGDPTTFPTRVADMLSPLAEVEDLNVAVSGSTSTQWVPGGVYWDTHVLANLDDADVLVISVGGNDFLELASTAGFGNIPQVLEDAEALVVEVVQNVRTIAAEVREVKPDLDVVFCLFVDYSASNQQPWDIVSLLPEGTIPGLIAQGRALFLPEDEIIVVDLLEASMQLDGPLDDLLADPLHFNDAGHQFYADEVFKALGGVHLAAAPIGDVHHYSFR